jgi:hypothetical protein
MLFGKSLRQVDFILKKAKKAYQKEKKKLEVVI